MVLISDYATMSHHCRICPTTSMHLADHCSISKHDLYSFHKKMLAAFLISYINFYNDSSHVYWDYSYFFLLQFPFFLLFNKEENIWWKSRTRHLTKTISKQCFRVWFQVLMFSLGDSHTNKLLYSSSHMLTQPTVRVLNKY